MSSVAIDEAVTGGALRTTHFFNGRLLTGEDLDREQHVQAARLARLATAIGDGVVEGLTIEVAAGSTAARPLVSVSPGLAISRSGLALGLPEETDVTLARTAPRTGSEPGGLFADCQPYTASEYSTGAGVYLLAIGPAATEEGLAPVSGLHNAEAPCNTAYAVEAVTFRLVRLALPLSELDDRKHLRNRVAYRMFAPAEVAELERDPFGGPLTTYGLLDQLRGVCLYDDEVPLALIGWEAGEGITFVDHWSVRRRVVRRSIGGGFGPQASDRLLAEGEARFLQFQEHVQDLVVESSDPGHLEASEAFQFLPAAGFLPVGVTSTLQGFHFADFFDDFTVRGPVHIAAANAPYLVRSSFAYPPIQVGGEEAIWLYIVRENIQASIESSDVQQCVLFANGHTPYAANAQFDLSYWNFANVAIRLA
jgi:hypothetical protein